MSSHITQKNDINVPVRKSVKVLLLNEENQLLLMHIDDPKTTTIKGKYHGSFWNPLGGAIEKNESLREAAIREVWEESSIILSKNNFGPIVWYGEVDLILNGTPTKIQQTFIVAKTLLKKFSLKNLTSSEKNVVKKLKWFSLKDLYNCEEVIYPVVLIDHIAEIFSEKLPSQPIKIDLNKQPDCTTTRP